MPEPSILDLQGRLSTGELTAVALAKQYLRRIAELDQAGPRLNAVIELNPDALDIAAALDRERAARGPCGPLHGIPVLLKDNIDTADRMQTTAGSLALVGARPAQDATVARKLRAAGALILGKTNLSEWANFRGKRSISGWSSRGGQTRNPYALDRNPSGSSSGSAVAVSADLSPLAVGTETDGSIISPAHKCGIVGIKPTVGLISRAGIIPIAHSQDTAGPMARSVTDAALLLAALVGGDDRDPATIGTPGAADGLWAALRGCESLAETLRAHLSPDGLRGARIGVARNFGSFHRRVDAIFEEAIAALRDAGAEIVDPADIATAGQFDEGELEVLLYEFKADLNAYLAGLGPQAPVRSLADVIAFNAAHAAQVLPTFGQELLELAQAKGPLDEEAYLRALANNHRLARAEGIDKTLRAYKLDAIIAPSGGPAWLIDPVNGDAYSGGSSSPAAVAGYPSITVPAGQVFGLPIGISFIGAAWTEPTLIRLAYAFEQITQARRPPTFRPSVGLTA